MKQAIVKILKKNSFRKSGHKSQQKQILNFLASLQELLKNITFDTYKNKLKKFNEDFAKMSYVENDIAHVSSVMCYTSRNKPRSNGTKFTKKVKCPKWFDELAMVATQRKVRRFLVKQRGKQPQVPVEAEKEKVDESEREELDESERKI